MFTARYEMHRHINLGQFSSLNRAVGQAITGRSLTVEAGFRSQVSFLHLRFFVDKLARGQIFFF